MKPKTQNPRGALAPFVAFAIAPLLSQPSLAQTNGTGPLTLDNGVSQPLVTISTRNGTTLPGKGFLRVGVEEN